MITEVVNFFVPGYPRTKGSLEVVRTPGAGRKSVVRESAKDSGTWRRLVAERARADLARRGCHIGVVLPARVLVHVRFTFLGDDVLSQYIGDLDKLERNILDALQDARVYDNDRQAVILVGDKDVDTLSGVQGAYVSAYLIEDAETARRLAGDLQAVIHAWTRSKTP